MKIYKVLLALIWTITFITPAIAESIEANQIVVYGQGIATTKADQAKILFTVIGLGSSLESAFEEARGKVSKISKQLIDLGIKESNLVTSSFHTGENYSKSFFSSEKDYRANLSMYVTIEDFEILEKVIIQIAQNEINSLSQAKYFLKDNTSLEQQARAKAIAEAKLKANEIASNLGVKVGRTLFAEEIPLIVVDTKENKRTSSRIRLEGDGGLDDSINIKGIFPDQISVESIVKVGYSIDITN